jgi:hypothetical protein
MVVKRQDKSQKQLILRLLYVCRQFFGFKLSSVFESGRRIVPFGARINEVQQESFEITDAMLPGICIGTRYQKY